MTIVAQGSKGAAVTRVQTICNQLGYKPALVIDGDAGVNTDKAIRWAQKLLGVGIDGQWGPDTDTAAARRLHKTPAPAPAPGPSGPGPKDVNRRATDYLMKWLGPKEQYSKNDGPWLRARQHEVGDDWMWQGHQPYCAEVGAVVAYHEADNLWLERLWPTVNWAYCPSIRNALVAGLKSKDGKWRLQYVSSDRLRYGDILLYDWNRDGTADHFEHFLRWKTILKLFRLRKMRTVGANTPKGPGGDQSGLGTGDGIWERDRYVADLIAGGRIVPA